MLLLLLLAKIHAVVVDMVLALVVDFVVGRDLAVDVVGRDPCCCC